MSKKQKTFVILDAHAIIHRAYHALPSFTTSTGEPTGALYGVMTMTIKIVETFHPDYIVAAFDLPKKTFRHEAYKDYKGKREKADDDLIVQLQSARTLFEAWGIGVLDSEGFEADDVIGTLVETYKHEKNIEIIVASGDMDTMQLVEGDTVRVFTLKKGLNDTVLYDEEAVRTRYGFGPQQLTDYKGLRGDPSDNIIGVPGIGEKTATTIIEVFGSIESLYEALEKDDTAKIKKAGLSPRIVTLLKDHKEDALFSKTLATIRRDAPVSFSLPQDPFVSSVQTEKLLEFCDKYEFRSLKPRIKKLFHVEDNHVEDAVEEDPELLYKTSVALWVLYSEYAAATKETIFQKTKTRTLRDAYQVILEELKKRNCLSIFENIEEPLIPIVKKMEEQGIRVDIPFLQNMVKDLGGRIRKIEMEVSKYTSGSVNLNSPKQLSALLFDTLGLKPKGRRKESGAFTTNVEVLEGLKDVHPIIPLILEHRELQKIASTYGNALIEHVAPDGKIHATFLQHGTTTGRFSSLAPNMQNIPAQGEWGTKVRHAFVAGEGNVFIACDYSQIELRVLAMLSGDQTLVDTFVRGEDIHTKVATKVFSVSSDAVSPEMRRSAKVINFGIIYGMGVSALQKNLGTTKENAERFYNDYFDAFPTIRTYLENSKETARTLGYTETLFGRRRYFPGISSGPSYLRAFAERMAMNAPIQGTAADIIKLAIISVDTALRDKGYENKARLVLQVHDELVYEVDVSAKEEVLPLITEGMTSVLDMFQGVKKDAARVPLAISVGVGERLDQVK